MDQENFDKLYNEGIEKNKISLTDSKVITSDDLIDAAIYRMYYQENKNIDKIQKILNEKFIQFKKDFENFL